MTRRTVVLRMAVAVLAITAATTAMASFLVEEYGSAALRNKDSDDFDNGYSGFKFHVGSTPIMLTKLGVWDGQNPGAGGSYGDGLEEICPVALYNSTMTTKLAEVTVPAGTGSDLLWNTFRFQSLASPVVLSANTDYHLVMDNKTGLNVYHNWSNTPEANTAITFQGAYWEYWGPGYETQHASGYNGGAGYAYIGPNAEFTAVPEPSSMVVCATALLGLLAYAWRRRR